MLPLMLGRRLTPLLLVLSLLVVGPAPASAALESRWPAAEAFVMELITCTRSGGWVREGGTCDAVDAAGRVPKRPALRHAARISDELARPYARRLARAGSLSHSLGGSIWERFARIGLGDGRVGENLGYAGGRDVMAAVLHIHRLFQAEWTYNGWHWRNLVDRRFARVGVGVWVRDGRTYLVLDFHG